jgi:hypothetical protein
MTQQIIVGLIVALAAVYAAWRWMPSAWRRSAASRLAAGTHRAGLVDADKARQLEASLARSSGCGSCDSCGACEPKDRRSAEPGHEASLDTHAR